jgi:CubicO group peptidase (beta-lactamase class C family)
MKSPGNAFPRTKTALCSLLLISPLCLMAQTPPPSSAGLAAALQPFVGDGTMAGAVMLVGSKDKILDLEAVGYSDLAAKKPMTTNDFFWIASMSKAMTTSLVMMLVDEGKVSIDDPVEKYLPEFKGQMVVDPKDPTHTPHPPSHPITIREILSHTSGIPFRPLGETGVLDNHPLAEEVAIYASHPLIFDPGSEYAYSNAGIGTGARIVEVVSGMPYEKFLQERLFDPLGMTDTTFWPTDEQLQRLAKSYTGPNPKAAGAVDPNAPKLTEIHYPEIYYNQLTYPLTDRTKRFPMPAGGLFSNATDVARFCQLFLNDGTFEGKRLLSPQAVKLATTKETGPKVKTGYGFGWFIGSNGEYSHGGAYNTYMGVEPDHGIVLVFMVQQGPHWGTGHGKDVVSTFVKAAHAMAGGATPDEKVHTEGQGQPH